MPLHIELSSKRFQASNATEADNWQSTLHCCAGVEYARSRSHEVALSALQSEMDKVEGRIESVHLFASQAYLYAMFSLQLMEMLSMTTHTPTVVGHQQQHAWQRELEALHVTLFTLKCYSAAIRGQEEPSCKVRVHKHKLCGPGS